MVTYNFFVMLSVIWVETTVTLSFYPLPSFRWGSIKWDFKVGKKWFRRCRREWLWKWQM